jgi:hypothetical protein
LASAGGLRVLGRKLQWRAEVQVCGYAALARRTGSRSAGTESAWLSIVSMTRPERKATLEETELEWLAWELAIRRKLRALLDRWDGTERARTSPHVLKKPPP